jgi:ABC-type spermidine/putrescine transport system permease subunit I
MAKGSGLRTQWRERLSGLLLISPVMGVVAVFIGFPIVAAALYSFGYTRGPNTAVSLIAQDQILGHHGNLTIGAYRQIFGQSDFLRSLIVTVLVTAVSTIIVLVLSWSIALYLRLRGGLVSKWLNTLAVVPLFLPTIIGAYAILTFYGGSGFVPSLLHILGWKKPPILAYSNPGNTVGQIWSNLPFGVLLISSGLGAVPQELIEAAQDAGARGGRRAFTILLPLCRLPTLITLTFTAISVVGSFTIPYLVGPNSPNMLGVLMALYFTTFNRPQQAEVMAMVVFGLAIGLAVVYIWSNFRNAPRRTGS